MSWIILEWEKWQLKLNYEKINRYKRNMLINAIHTSWSTLGKWILLILVFACISNCINVLLKKTPNIRLWIWNNRLKLSIVAWDSIESLQLGRILNGTPLWGTPSQEYLAIYSVKYLFGWEILFACDFTEYLIMTVSFCFISEIMPIKFNFYAKLTEFWTN